MHTLEVVVDDRTDRAIRDQWAALADAGLPSQARHRAASNRPHVSLALTAAIGPAVERALQQVADMLPLPITVGGLLVFGSQKYVLARAVVPSAALLELQGTIGAALDEQTDPRGHFAPGRWTPHITLARRLTAAQVADALTVLGDVPAIDGELAAARRWDMTGKQETWVVREV